MSPKRLTIGRWEGEFAEEFADSGLRRLFEGDQFPSPAFPGRVEEFHKNIGITWRVSLGGGECFMKSFRHGTLEGLKRLFMPIGAARSWRAARIMVEAGLETPQPVGFMERRERGLVVESAFINQAVPGQRGKNLEAWFRENFDLPRLGAAQVREKREIISLLAELFRKAHGQDRIYFPDFHPHNLVLGRDDEGRARIYMVDFDEVNFRVRRDDRMKNLSSLGRNAAKIEKKMKHKSLTRLDRLRFLRAYLGQNSGHDDLLRLWQNVLANWELK